MPQSHPSPMKIFQNAMMAHVNAAVLATAATHSLFTHMERGADTADAIAKRARVRTTAATDH